MLRATSRQVSAPLIAALAALALALPTPSSLAQNPPPPAPTDAAMPGAPRAPGSEMPAGYVPPVLEKAREAAGIDDRTGQKVPMDLTFIDGAGRTVRLGDYFTGERPVVIQMAYYRCPQLCGEISLGMVRSMKALTDELKISDDFQVLTISFDSRETPALAASNKEAVIEVLGRAAGEDNVRNGWDFLVGEDANIKALTDGLGYRFGWIEEAQQYSHPAAIVLCAPDGTITRYLTGTTHEPQTLRLSLIDASQGTITPSLKDAFILGCFDYDPAIGKYTATAYTLMRIAGATTVVTLAGIIGFLILAERRGKLRRHPNAGTTTEDLERAPAASPVPSRRKDPRPPRTAFSG